jgi:hypothetical protein
VIATLVGLTLGFQNCSHSKSNSSQAPSNTSSGSGKNGGTTTDNPKPTVDVVIAGSGEKTETSAQLCLGQITFTGADGVQARSAAPAATPSPSSSSYMPDMSAFYKAAITGDTSQMMASIMQYTESLMGMSLMLASTSNYVTSIPMSMASYTSADLSLDSSCPYGSLSVPTDAGLLNVAGAQVLHFTGNVNLVQSRQIVLNVQDILSALSSAQSGADVTAILAKVSGNF